MRKSNYVFGLVAIAYVITYISWSGLAIFNSRKNGYHGYYYLSPKSLNEYWFTGHLMVCGLFYPCDYIRCGLLNLEGPSYIEPMYNLGYKAAQQVDAPEPASPAR